MEPVTDWEALSREINKDRRRGKRVNLKFPIEVSGFNRMGMLFAETTETDDVSESGCRFKLAATVERGDVVAIKLLSRLRPDRSNARAELFQVAWRAAQKDDDGWSVGALKLRDDKFWEVNFPPRNPPESPK